MTTELEKTQLEIAKLQLEQEKIKLAQAQKRQKVVDELGQGAVSISGAAVKGMKWVFKAVGVIVVLGMIAIAALVWAEKSGHGLQCNKQNMEQRRQALMREVEEERTSSRNSPAHESEQNHSGIQLMDSSDVPSSTGAEARLIALEAEMRGCGLL